MGSKSRGCDWTSWWAGGAQQRNQKTALYLITRPDTHITRDTSAYYVGFWYSQDKSPLIPRSRRMPISKKEITRILYTNRTTGMSLDTDEQRITT